MAPSWGSNGTSYGKHSVVPAATCSAGVSVTEASSRSWKFPSPVWNCTLSTICSPSVAAAPSLVTHTSPPTEFTLNDSPRSSVTVKRAAAPSPRNIWSVSTELAFSIVHGKVSVSRPSAVFSAVMIVGAT